MEKPILDRQIKSFSISNMLMLIMFCVLGIVVVFNLLGYDLQNPIQRTSAIHWILGITLGIPVSIMMLPTLIEIFGPLIKWVVIGMAIACGFSIFHFLF